MLAKGQLQAGLVFLIAVTPTEISRTATRVGTWHGGSLAVLMLPTAQGKSRAWAAGSSSRCLLAVNRHASGCLLQELSREHVLATGCRGLQC